MKKRDSRWRRKVDPPRGVLTTPEAGGRFRHERYHPSPDLADCVEHYWVVEWDLRGRPPHRAETLPHPSVHMIFEPRRSRIRGPARARFARRLAGRGGVFAVKFTPAGFRPFARRPVSAFTDTTVSLRTVFGDDGAALDRAILAAPTDGARIAIVEGFLRARYRRDGNVARVSAIAAAAAGDRGVLKVDDLVARFGLNKRTLQRLFASYVGVSPKWVIQRYRLHEAAEQLASSGAGGHAALALQLGYSDQAHFVRDFKAIVGLSPAAYARAAHRVR